MDTESQSKFLKFLKKWAKKADLKFGEQKQVGTYGALWVDSVLQAGRLNMTKFESPDIDRLRALLVHCNVMGADVGTKYETVIRTVIYGK